MISLSAAAYTESAAERIKRRRNKVVAPTLDLDAQLPKRKQPLALELREVALEEPAVLKKRKRPVDVDEITDVSLRHISAREPESKYTKSADPDDDKDRDFALRTRSSLQHLLLGRKKDVGYYQMHRISQLLEKAAMASAIEGPCFTEDEAVHWLATNTHDRPIFLSNQQPMPLMTVERALGEFYDDQAEIYIQDPHRISFDSGTYPIAVRRVKERLLSNEDPHNPWNCLELAAHFEDGTRPRFLNGEDFRLLTKIKIPSAKTTLDRSQLGRKRYENGYKEVEKWMLLAQAGALTNPHQDSHGYSTYITVNQGIVGFGWLHCPTDVERQAWLKAPASYAGGTWRYRILRAGDTVFFPTGQVHFVFRHQDAGHTLAFGGHVLRCSTIVPWITTMLDQLNSQYITNEEWNSSANGYVRQVAIFVEQALRSGTPKRFELWGGLESILQFLSLKSKLEEKTLTKPRRARKVNSEIEENITVSTHKKQAG